MGGPVTRLHETHGFGSNPGNLRMMRYLPPALAERPALVVVLHGCAQSAAGYDLGAGWSTLADRYGFALLLPEQQRSNNPNGCFNWFLPEHNRRGEGEALSIRQMIERVIIEHGIDRSRVFITGLSAGGAMTSTMLACYPEVFAAGAIIAGLPYGAATNVKEAFQSMYQSPTRAAGDWGDLVRQASPHKGPWPRVSVWHGSADKTVIPLNAREILKQWTDVHGLSLTQSVHETVDGYPREFWTDPSGLERIESYTITDMAHGTPLATNARDGACGATGPFLLQVGISSSYHIAKFFNIAGAPLTESAREAPTSVTIAPVVERDTRAAAPLVLEGEVLDPEPEPAPRFGTMPPPAFEIGAVINRALKAAGLIRD
jgi:feruloyl esterase